MSLHDAEHPYWRPPERWIEAQQVALGTSLLALAPPRNRQRSEVFTRVAGPFATPLASELTQTEQAGYRARLRTFPPAALEALASLDDGILGVWEQHKALWDQALSSVKWNGKLSPVAGGKLIANRIASGGLSPAQLIRLAKLELGVRWNESPAVIGALADLSSQFSRPHATTTRRLLALREFGRNHTLPGWPMIENALLQQIYSWPLLVLALNDQKAPCALPIAIDVYLGTENSPLSPPRIITNGLIDGAGWEASIRRALLAAIRFWHTKHQAWDQDFQKSVRNASVAIDLRTAEAVLEPYANTIWAPGGKFYPEGKSLEAYFTLAILAHLIDRGATETVCATGILGKPSFDGDIAADYGMIPSEDAERKAECAGGSFYFDKMIVVSGTPKISNCKPHLRICEGRWLSDFAAHTFGQEWRRHRYIRAPDIDLTFKSKTARNETEIQNVRREIRSNTGSVLLLDRSVSAASVAHALYDVNSEAGRGESVGNFFFIRAVPEEINERFWHVVWDALGGKMAAFEEFRFSVSLERPAELLAEELNRFKPSKNSPCRSPDILVIIGSDHLLSNVATLPHGPFARLGLHPVMTELARPGRLQSSPIPAFQDLVGNTRVILVPDPAVADIVTVPLYDIPEHLRETVRALSVFRHGFTHQNARTLLNLDDWACTDLLNELRTTKLNGRNILDYTAKVGEFILRTRIENLGDPNRRAALNFQAANAIVGFLDKTDAAARFDYREALEPARLHEAQSHLLKAAKTTDSKLFSRAVAARERISHIGEMFGWTRVRWAAIHSNQASDEIARDLRTYLQTAACVHPIELVWAARFVFKLAQEIGGDVQQKERMTQLLAERDRYLVWAYQSCSTFDRWSVNGVCETDACRFVVATSRAAMIMTEMPDGKGLSLAAPDIRLAEEYGSSAIEILDDQWFEFMGDRLAGSSPAADAYREGILNPRFPFTQSNPRIQTIVKYLACCRDPDTEVLNCIHAMSDGVKGYVRKTWHAADSESGLWKLSHIARRWELGRARLLKILGMDDGPDSGGKKIDWSRTRTPIAAPSS